jgi:hypothetical protein
VIAHRALTFEPAFASCHAIIMSTPRQCRRLLLLRPGRGRSSGPVFGNVP